MWSLRLFLLLSLSVGDAAAGEILDSGVDRDGNHYELFVDAVIDAAPGRVFDTITDYEHLATINPDFESSRVLSRQDGVTRVRTQIRVCILVFCKTVVQVQDVHYPEPLAIEASMVPGAGDFRSGSARWQLAARGQGTYLHFTETFVPDFWVPPVIGPWLIRRKLVQEVEVTTRFIEHRSAESAP